MVKAVANSFNEYCKLPTQVLLLLVAYDMNKNYNPTPPSSVNTGRLHNDKHGFQPTQY